MTRRVLPHAPRTAFAGTVLFVGEIAVDEGTGNVYVGDGVTLGGILVGGRTGALNVNAFGARPGLSAAVNTAAIQAALDAAVAASASGIEFGIIGTYAITSVALNNATGLFVEGNGATLSSVTNATVFAVNNCTRVKIRNLNIAGNFGTVVNNQRGYSFNTVSYCSLTGCYVSNCSTGIYTQDSALGYPLTGSFQRPSEMSNNFVQGCYDGIFTEDGAPGNAGEYWRITNNTVLDCNRAGIFCCAGNIAIIGNTFNGNKVGAWLIHRLAGAVNSDHGIFSLNTVNHNARCGLYVDTNLRSWTITGNNIWATLGGLTGTEKLKDSTGAFPGTQDYAFGVYFQSAHDVTFTGNVIGRNQFNMGVVDPLRCIVGSNVFLTDPASTVAQFKDFSAVPSGNFNRWGPNDFDGVWTDMATFPTTGDPNRKRFIGATGEPAFTNAWVNFGGAFAPAGYFIDSDNIVHLFGLIKTGTLGVSAFQLPAGFRPFDGNRNFAVISNSAFGYVSVQTDGSVIPIAPSSNVWVSLDGIAFRAT